MLTFSEIGIDSIAVTMLAITAAQLILFHMYKTTKDKKYDEIERRIEMEKLRDSMEKRIYDLTERMVSREDRWRDINHLIIDKNVNKRTFPEKPEKTKSSSFLSSAGLANDDFEIEEDLVFVITPFSDKYSSDYARIKQVCDSVGLRCMRGDEDFIRGDILPHILKLIVKSRVVVANINGRNPNVFYELGIAHALDKPTIITSKTIDNIPFDLRTQQLVIYNLEEQLGEQLSKALLKLTLKAPNK